MLVAKIHNPDGTISVLRAGVDTALPDETEEQTIARVAARDLPAGTQFEIVDAATLTPSKSDLAFYSKQKQFGLLEAGIVVDVTADGQARKTVLVDGTNPTRADLAMLALFGKDYPTESKIWVDNNGVSTLLTGEELIALATAAGNWVSNTYAFVGSLLGEIASGSITTTEQIDAAAWPAA